MQNCLQIGSVTFPVVPWEMESTQGQSHETKHKAVWLEKENRRGRNHEAKVTTTKRCLSTEGVVNNNRNLTRTEGWLVGYPTFCILFPSHVDLCFYILLV